MHHPLARRHGRGQERARVAASMRATASRRAPGRGGTSTSWPTPAARASRAPSSAVEWPQPRLPAGVLLGRVLRVVDEHVGAARQREQAGVERAGVVLGVGGVDDAAAAVLDAIGEAAVRVVGRAPARTVASPTAKRAPAAHARRSELGAHRVEADGEVRRAHLRVERARARRRSAAQRSGAVDATRLPGT